jgi:hypothetical protein
MPELREQFAQGAYEAAAVDARRSSTRWCATFPSAGRASCSDLDVKPPVTRQDCASRRSTARSTLPLAVIGSASTNR